MSPTLQLIVHQPTKRLTSARCIGSTCKYILKKNSVGFETAVCAKVPVPPEILKSRNLTDFIMPLEFFKL